MTKNLNLFELFIKNRYYLRKAGVQLDYVRDDCSDYLYIDNPIVISAFAGFVKQKSPRKNIFFRGECHNNRHVIPSLFRASGMPLDSTDEVRRRVKAYNELKRSVMQHFKRLPRFAEDVDVLFQHYGVKSPVIDLVDNIYVALWFAMDGNDGDYGYIRLMNTSHRDLKVTDLRKKHSSTSLRLHTQHGLIAKKTVRTWNCHNILFDDYEIARIKFPVRSDMLQGLLFSRDNIYPSADLDNTLKILQWKGWMEDEMRRIEARHGLASGVLGKIG